MNKVKTRCVTVLSCAVLAFASPADEWFDGGVSAAWPQTAVGGFWQQTAEGASATVLGEKVSFHVADGADLRFVATEAEPLTRREYVVSTTMSFSDCPVSRLRALRPIGSRDKGSIAVATEEGLTRYYGAVDGTWQPLTGATPKPGEAVSVALGVRVVGGAVYVRYAVDGVALLCDGEEWVRSAASAVDATVSSASYTGSGEITALSAAYEDLPAARIGDEPYETLAAALDAAEYGQTVELASDADEAVTLPRGVRLVTGGYLVGMVGPFAAYYRADPTAPPGTHAFVLDEEKVRPTFGAFVPGASTDALMVTNARAGLTYQTVGASTLSALARTPEPCGAPRTAAVDGALTLTVERSPAAPARFYRVAVDDKPPAQRR